MDRFSSPAAASAISAALELLRSDKKLSDSIEIHERAAFVGGLARLILDSLEKSEGGFDRIRAGSKASSAAQGRK
jgi:Leu/Phe-tRNA-protein transferase